MVHRHTLKNHLRREDSSEKRQSSPTTRKQSESKIRTICPENIHAEQSVANHHKQNNVSRPDNTEAIRIKEYPPLLGSSDRSERSTFATQSIGRSHRPKIHTDSRSNRELFIQNCHANKTQTETVGARHTARGHGRSIETNAGSYCAGMRIFAIAMSAPKRDATSFSASDPNQSSMDDGDQAINCSSFCDLAPFVFNKKIPPNKK
mmetsp:Transcript_25021/g.36642  ORF Transcript_25021/g.36642 Transcript_25021/m.36642 type:complete len:205 (-) Transcript_25021:1275-1889(-)